MKLSLSLAAAGCVLAATVAAQPSLSGSWRGATNSDTPIVLDLTEKGATLTGTFTRDGASAPISEGKVAKEGFSFKAKINDREEAFSGERAGDELKIWLDRQGRTKAIALERAERTPKR